MGEVGEDLTTCGFEGLWYVVGNRKSWRKTLNRAVALKMIIEQFSIGVHLEDEEKEISECRK